MASFCSEADCGTKKFSEFPQVTEPVSGRGRRKVGLLEEKTPVIAGAISLSLLTWSKKRWV